VSENEVEQGPVVSPGDAADRAREEMRRFGLDWATVVEDGRLRGWVNAAALEGRGTVGEVEPRKFSAYVTSSSSLRQALDSIVTSRTQVAVVAGDGDRYVGILTLERLSKEVVS